MVKLLYKTLSSLRLTVVLLLFGTLLVFFGTLAQVDQGLYQAQSRYFRSFFIYMSVGGGPAIPVLPGGYTVGSLLLINLVAAHVQRFKLTRAKAGIFLVHIGLVLLLLGQLLTDMLSRESGMRLARGESRGYSEDFRQNELVIINKSDAQTDEVVSIPESRLTHSKEISHPKLPFTIRTKRHWSNAELTTKAEAGAIPSDATQGTLRGVHVKPLALETDTDRRNLPAAEVELSTAGGSLGTFLISCQTSAMQSVHVQGVTYEVALRMKRHYRPYTITLLDAAHDVYRGTEIPKNFSSVVRVDDPQNGEKREVKISMNQPLRYRGDTYYQYQMAPDEAGNAAGVSTLQVVRNPSWLTPYLACVLVSGGLIVQFLMHLLTFIKKRIT